MDKPLKHNNALIKGILNLSLAISLLLSLSHISGIYYQNSSRCKPAAKTELVISKKSIQQKEISYQTLFKTTANPFQGIQQKHFQILSVLHSKFAENQLQTLSQKFIFFRNKNDHFLRFYQNLSEDSPSNLS